jgi:hypothetical protein
LVAIFEPMQRRSWQTEASRKFRVCHFTAAFTQKFAELTFERVGHAPSLPKWLFRMWNNLLYTPRRILKISVFWKIFENFVPRFP